MKLTVSLDAPAHPFRVVDEWVKEFAKGLTDRWEPVAHTLSLWVADQEAGYLLTPAGLQELRRFAASLLQQSTLEMVDEHTRQVVAYGAQVARVGETALSNPPEASSLQAILEAPSKVTEAAMQFSRIYTLNEVQTKDVSVLSGYQTRLLDTLQAGEHPSKAAREMAADIDGDYHGWMRIARTETARSLNTGLFAEAGRFGARLVYVPHSPTTCPACAELIDGRVFNASDLQQGSNFKRKRADWVAALPLHPNCTHFPMPASQWVEAAAREAAGGEIPPDGVKIDFLPPSQR